MTQEQRLIFPVPFGRGRVVVPSAAARIARKEDASPRRQVLCTLVETLFWSLRHRLKRSYSVPQVRLLLRQVESILARQVSVEYWNSL